MHRNKSQQRLWWAPNMLSNFTNPDLYLLFTYHLYLSCNDFRGQAVCNSSFFCCFVFIYTALDLRKIWIRTGSFPTCRNKMQPCGSQHKNKCQHVWNTVPVIIEAHKQFCFCLHGTKLADVHKWADRKVSKERSWLSSKWIRVGWFSFYLFIWLFYHASCLVLAESLRKKQ